MTAAAIIARTNEIYKMFKCIVRLNQYRFKDMHIDTVIDLLITYAGVDPSYISRQYAAQRIIAYCDVYDTGIYY